jgi:hypothetical protein
MSRSEPPPGPAAAEECCLTTPPMPVCDSAPYLEKPGRRAKSNKPEVTDSRIGSERQIDFRKEQRAIPNDTSEHQGATRSKTCRSGPDRRCASDDHQSNDDRGEVDADAVRNNDEQGDTTRHRERKSMSTFPQLRHRVFVFFCTTSSRPRLGRRLRRRLGGRKWAFARSRDLDLEGPGVGCALVHWEPPRAPHQPSGMGSLV